MSQLTNNNSGVNLIFISTLFDSGCCKIRKIRFKECSNLIMFQYFGSELICFIFNPAPFFVAEVV